MTEHVIVLASDHAGFALKKILLEHLNAIKVPHIDIGPFDGKTVDYPDFAHPACMLVSSREHLKYRGMLICGSGIGMAMVANRYERLRCAVAERVETAVLARQHNNANVLALGAHFVSPEDAISILDVFISTDYEGGRHHPRVAKINRPSESGVGNKVVIDALSGKVIVPSQGRQADGQAE